MLASGSSRGFSSCSESKILNVHSRLKGSLYSTTPVIRMHLSTQSVSQAAQKKTSVLRVKRLGLNRIGSFLFLLLAHSGSSTTLIVFLIFQYFILRLSRRSSGIVICTGGPFHSVYLTLTPQLLMKPSILAASQMYVTSSRTCTSSFSLNNDGSIL